MNPPVSERVSLCFTHFCHPLMTSIDHWQRLQTSFDTPGWIFKSGQRRRDLLSYSVFAEGAHSCICCRHQHAAAKDSTHSCVCQLLLELVLRDDFVLPCTETECNTPMCCYHQSGDMDCVSTRALLKQQLMFTKEGCDAFASTCWPDLLLQSADDMTWPAWT